MRICVLGFGNVGAQLARLWTQAGHAVCAGLREGSKHRQTAQSIGIDVRVPSEAVRGAEAVVLAVPWAAVPDALKESGPLDQRVLVDATNPLASDLSVVVPEAGSGAEQIAQWTPGARVVKAFNTIGAVYLGNPAFDLFTCSDDREAEQFVHGLIRDLHMHPVSTGPLRNARYLEQLAGLWIDLAVKRRIEGAFGFNLVKAK